MRQTEIVKTLRKRITGGEFPPGATLPLRSKLLEEYSISVATFQKCINQLTREGFLKSRGIKGTVVPKYPPHLFDYALVFPESPEQTNDSFFPALRNAGEQFAAENPGLRLRHYFVGGMEPHTGKYADHKVLFQCLCWITWAIPYISKWHKVFRMIDKNKGMKRFETVDRKTMFLWQYNGLKKLLEEAGVEING